ncbi:hypothetical protein O3G_MSEX000899, partial [Manduca sexta]
VPERCPEQAGAPAEYGGPAGGGGRGARETLAAPRPPRRHLHRARAARALPAGQPPGGDPAGAAVAADAEHAGRVQQQAARAAAATVERARAPGPQRGAQPSPRPARRTR